MSTILGSPLSIGGGGAKIGVTLNEDGTQNLFLTDNNTVLNLLAGTEDATATPADVASGKTFYAQGQKKTGTATMEPAVTEPVLLWTNTNPNAEFAAQTLQLDMSNYGGALIEAGSLNWGVIDANAKTINYVRKQDGYQGLGSVRAGTISSGSYSRRWVTVYEWIPGQWNSKQCSYYPHTHLGRKVHIKLRRGRI